MRIVVHLHLAIELKTAFAGKDLPPKRIETVCKIHALLFKNGKAVFIAMAMSVGGGFTLGLLTRVVNLQRKNGQTVNDEARRFRVERGGAILIWNGAKKRLIDFLDEVVALLVQAIDRVLDGGNIFSGRAHVASHVFLVPEIKVGTMLIKNGNEQAVTRDDEARQGGCGAVQFTFAVWIALEVAGMMWGKVMPFMGGAVVVAGDLSGVNHRLGKHGTGSATLFILRVQ